MEERAAKDVSNNPNTSTSLDQISEQIIALFQSPGREVGEKRFPDPSNVSQASGVPEGIECGCIGTLHGTGNRSQFIFSSPILLTEQGSVIKVQEDRKEQLLKCSSATGILSRVSGDSEDNFKAQEDRMEQLSKHSSATVSLSCVAGDSTDIYGGSIWAQRGTKIHPVYTKLMEVMNSWRLLLMRPPQRVLRNFASLCTVGALMRLMIRRC